MRSLIVLVVTTAAFPAFGAQIVAMDVAPTGGIKKTLAQAI